MSELIWDTFNPKWAVHTYNHYSMNLFVLTSDKVVVGPFYKKQRTRLETWNTAWPLLYLLTFLVVLPFGFHTNHGLISFFA